MNKIHRRKIVPTIAPGPAGVIAKLHTKADIAAAKHVSMRTIDNWVTRGLLPRPRKWGTALQARVRWTDEDLSILDRNLSGSSK